MSVKGFFGVPGCGKTTKLVQYKKKYGKYYDNVYCVNVDIKGCIRITKSDFQNYIFPNSLILWDEITLDYDNRDFKCFTLADRRAWLLHRHAKTDIVYVTQNYEFVDRKIKEITTELWYMSKSVVPFFSSFTTCKRIYRCITINELNSDLIMGYRFATLLERFFVSSYQIMFRPRYYRYFDSFDLLDLKDRPVFGGDKVVSEN